MSDSGGSNTHENTQGGGVDDNSQAHGRHQHNHEHQHSHHHHHHHSHGDHSTEEGKMMGQDKFDSDEVAKDWSSDPLVLFLNTRLHDVILEKYEAKLTSHSTTVLDFGCGSGLLTKRLQGKVQQIVGVDVSKAMIDVYNEQKYTNAMGLCENLIHPHPTQLDGRKFDFIISCYALHHVAEPAKMVSILASYLKNGGCMLFGEFEPTANSPKEFFKPGELSQWMREAGLADAKEIPAFKCRPEELPESKFARKGDMLTSVIIGAGTLP